MYHKIIGGNLNSNNATKGYIFYWHYNNNGIILSCVNWLTVYITKRLLFPTASIYILARQNRPTG